MFVIHQKNYFYYSMQFAYYLQYVTICLYSLIIYYLAVDELINVLYK